MRLTETKLRDIVREELSRLMEELTGESREYVAEIVEEAVDFLGLRLRRNTAGGRRSGEIEYVNDSDDMGFFVQGENRGQVQIVGRGREMSESGTRVSVEGGDRRDNVLNIAAAIEEEPLEARRRR